MMKLIGRHLYRVDTMYHPVTRHWTVVAKRLFAHSWRAFEVGIDDMTKRQALAEMKDWLVKHP